MEEAAPVQISLGPGYASSVSKEYLDEFNDALKKKDDVFSQKMEKFVSMVGIKPNYRNDTKYKSPEGSGGAKAKSVDQEYRSGYHYLELAEPPFDMAKLVRLSEKSTPHYAAVMAKVSNITELGHDFIESAAVRDSLSEKTEDEKRRATTKIKKAKARLSEWVEGLNDEDELSEVLSKVLIDYYLTGNGYIEIGRTPLGAVGYIGHVPSVTVRVRRSRDGFVQIVGDRVTYFRNFGKKTPNPIGGDSSPNEIIHIKNYSPISGYYGVPEIVSALTAVAGTELAAKYNLDYFQNKATPRYVIVSKGASLSATAQKQILDFFETGIKGSNHRSVYVPLPADTQEGKTSFEMKPVEAGVQEASFDKYVKSNTSFILMAHRVPITKIGIAEGASLAVARDADKTFKEQVCRPMQSRIEKKINRVIHTYTDMFDFKLNELSLTDEDTQSKIDERYVRNKIKVPNEIRARMGDPAYEGGDKPVELTARQAADANTDTRGTRTRDADRSAGATDSAGEGRNAKGDGRTTE